jgi:hypothetical protein
MGAMGGMGGMGEMGLGVLESLGRTGGGGGGGMATASALTRGSTLGVKLNKMTSAIGSVVDDFMIGNGIVVSIVGNVQEHKNLRQPLEDIQKKELSITPVSGKKQGITAKLLSISLFQKNIFFLKSDFLSNFKDHLLLRIPSLYKDFIFTEFQAFISDYF